MGDKNLLLGAPRLARHPPGPAGPRGSPAQAGGSWPGEEARGADVFAARRRAAGGRSASQPGLRGGSRRRWAMHLGRPEAEVGEDLFDDRGLVNDSDDPHGAPYSGPSSGSASWTCLMNCVRKRIQPRTT